MSELCIRELYKSFAQYQRGGQRLDVLRGLDLDLAPGSFTVVNGPSGSGKSSLLRCIYRTYLPDSGSVTLRLADQSLDLAAAPERDVLAARRDCIGMATQFLQAVPRLSALELVAGEGLSEDEAAVLLLSLGLDPSLLSLPPATFSGGERQMVNLAIALARPRPLLLLDEVTASLDAKRAGLALQALRALKRGGTTMLAVFHTIPRLPGLVDRVVELRDGRVAA